MFCVGLVGRTNCVFNKEVSPSEYDRLLAEYAFWAGPLLDDAKNRFQDFLRSETIRSTLSDAASNSSGNYIRRSTDVHRSFEVFDSAQIWYSHDIRRSRKVLDSLFVADSEQISQSLNISRSRGVSNSIECRDVEDLSYCSHCDNSAHLFGCIGLRGEQYCIFNMRYTKSEYEALMGSISAHLQQRGLWGVSIPVGFSGHPYNRSAAQEYMPLTKVPAKMMGFGWDEDDKVYRPSELLGDKPESGAEMYAEMPLQLEENTLERSCKAVYLCAVTGRPFQLLGPEGAFLVSEKIAPPRISFQQRFIERLSRITPHELHEVKCGVSGRNIFSAVPTRWKQKVYDPTLKSQ